MIQSDAWRNLVVFGQVYRDVAKGCAGRDEMIAFVVHFHLTFVLIDCNEYQLYTVAFSQHVSHDWELCFIWKAPKHTLKTIMKEKRFLIARTQRAYHL